MKLEERTSPTESIIPARLAVYLSLSSSSPLQSLNLMCVQVSASQTPTRTQYKRSFVTSEPLRG